MITQIPLNYCSPTPSPSLLYSPSKTPTHIRPCALHPKCPLCQRKAQSRVLWCHSNLWPFQLHSQPFLAASLLVPNLSLFHFTVKLFLCCPSSSVSCSPSLTHSQQIAVTFNSLWQERLPKEKNLTFSHQKFDQSFFSFWPNLTNCPESLAKVSSFTESGPPAPLHPSPLIPIALSWALL